MDRSRVAVTVALVVLAGCGGFVGGDSAGDASRLTVTPAPVPTTATTPERPAPGITEDGVTDPGALADAHAAALSTSYTLGANQTVRYADGRLRARRDVTVRVASNHSRHHVTISVAGPEAARLLGEPPAGAEFWSDGEHYLRAYTRGNRTTYNTFRPTLTSDAGAVGTTSYWVSTAAPGGQPWNDIQPLFRAFETGPAERVDLLDRRLYRVTSTRLAHPDTLARVEGVETISDGRLGAVIDRNGLVRRYRLRYTGRIGDETVHVTRTVRYTDVGSTTVGIPRWYPRATNETIGATFGSGSS